MISAWIVAVVLQDQAPAATETAGELVSKMLSNYSTRKSMAGQIRFVQSVGNVSVSVESQFQFEQPSLLFIRQVRRSSDPASALVTSDGKYFSYDAPRESAGGQRGKRLVESVKQSGRTLDVKEIYAACGSSLLDRSAALDIAIGRLEDLKFARNQWATLGYIRAETPEGVKAVGGQWRPYGTAPIAGTFEMWITDSGDLRRYVLRETIAVANQGPQAVTSDWQIQISTEPKLDGSLFRLVR